MQQQYFEVVNRLGLHARASALVVKAAAPFQADIRLGLDDREANGKSIVGVMALAAAKGSKVKLTVDGPDEAVACQIIGALFRDGFGEM